MNRLYTLAISSSCHVTLGLLVVGCTTPASQVSSPSSTDSCGPGGRLRPLDPRIVATTVSPNGDVFDWIPIDSQTPNGIAATPPPFPPDSPSGTPQLPVTEPLTTSAGGPPGTVPILRPYRPRCDCFAGYHDQADGSCVEDATHCSGPGNMASPKSYTICCPGLIGIEDSVKQNGQCNRHAPDALICAACGDHVCGLGENECNCPSDCPP